MNYANSQYNKRGESDNLNVVRGNDNAEQKLKYKASVTFISSFVFL